MHMEQESDDSDDVISALNVIPFIDICLVLLIIVLVTASFTVALIGFDLPQGVKTEYVEAKSAVTVDVGSDGRCTIGGQGRRGRPDSGLHREASLSGRNVPCAHRTGRTERQIATRGRCGRSDPRGREHPSGFFRYPGPLIKGRKGHAKSR